MTMRLTTTPDRARHAPTGQGRRDSEVHAYGAAHPIGVATARTTDEGCGTMSGHGGNVHTVPATWPAGRPLPIARRTGGARRAGRAAEGREDAAHGRFIGVPGGSSPTGPRSPPTGRR